VTAQENLDEYKQRVIADFNQRTKYDEGNNFYPPLAHRLVELARLHRGQRVLDIATGTGNVAIPAAQLVGSLGKVVGVDISPVMLRQAWRKILAAGFNNIELQQADADYVNFGDMALRKHFRTLL
jgi:ubiquinone/menaquinone biosynthesis C-methylase UbiE